MSSDSRRRLGAITALVAGLFVGLTLLPFPVTGPIGHSLGQALWRVLGAGALGIPLLGMGLALAGFERLGALDMKRSAFLIVGLSVLLPYLTGVLFHVTVADLDTDRFLGRMVGVVPGFFAVQIPKGIGVAGAVLAGFLALCALTLATFAWHPLQRLERQPDEPEGSAKPLAAKGEKAEGKRKAALEPPVEDPARVREERRQTANQPRAGCRRNPSRGARQARRISAPSGTWSCSRPRAPRASMPAKASSTRCRSGSKRRWPSSRSRATWPAALPGR